jgi:hypothetical protein
VRLEGRLERLEDAPRAPPRGGRRSSRSTHGKEQDVARPDLTIGDVERMAEEEPGSAARYLEERRAELEAEEQERREEDDYQRFEEQFVSAGGERSAAREAYWDIRNANALAAAALADEDASMSVRRRIAQSL